MPFPVTNPGTAPSGSSATNWGDIRGNINSQLDLIAKYYDKPTIDEMLAQLGGSGKMVVVDVLPATGEDGFIYLISHDGTGNPPFDMYIWTQDNTFQLIGDTTIDLSNVYTKQEANDRFQIQLIAGDLINLTDTGIISVTNVYNKQEVEDLIDAIDTVKMLVVPALPTVGRVNVIYLTPTEDPDVYEQWIWEIDSSVTPPTEGWKQVGTMEIDLTNYYTKTETDEKFLQIKDEKVLVYPFVGVGDSVEEMLEKLKEGKAIVLSTYDENNPETAEFGWLSEYTDTYFVVEMPTERATYTFDANYEITNISVDDEPPLYRRDYRFGGNETDRLIRNIFTQAKTYNEDTELSLDENVTVYSEGMFYKLLVTNNSLTDPITLTLDTGITNPYGWDMTIPVGEQVLYLFVREDHELKLLYSTRELNKKQDGLEEGVAITPLTDNQKLSVVNLTTKKVDHVTGSDIWDYVEDKIDGAVSNVLTEDFPTGNRAVVSNPMGKFAICDTTTEEINHVHGVTSNIQTQFDNIKTNKENPLRYTTPGYYDSLAMTDLLSTVTTGVIRGEGQYPTIKNASLQNIYDCLQTEWRKGAGQLTDQTLTNNKALVSDSNGKVATISTAQQLTSNTLSNSQYMKVDANGKIQTRTNANVVADLKTQLVNLIYPVGAIYISYSSTSPATLFGGTWTQISGRFLVASGSASYSYVNTSGSSATGTVTFTGTNTGGSPRVQLTTDTMPKHNHNLPYRRCGSTTGSDWRTDPGSVDDYAGRTGTAGGGSYPSGYGAPFNNLPPYLVVYMRRRTA